MQRSQIDFLNHGILPFIGREREMATILEFWRETAESSELRAMLLLGEAGIGKSRLIEESIRRIGASGGVVVHIKLYPDSATSLAPLLARALARSGGAQQLLKAEPEETFASVSAALIRICGLRPTLLVIEDLHLLHGDGLGDFSLLLQGLADEPLSLLCAARPVTLPARSVLERYLTSQLDLTGLPPQEIALLCGAVLGEQAGEELVEILREKTLGNALALRSALRAGLKSGAMAAGTGPSGSAPLRDQRSFIDTLEQNVRLLSEGMAAHLNEPEKSAAEKLACLGEVFAAETAGAVLENATGMLEALSFKGVIAPLVSPPSPVSIRRSATPPLAFTHTLLHRHFIDHAKADPNPLIRVVAEALPLYSILPFSLITAHCDEVIADAATLRMSMTETLETARRLDSSTDWRYAIALWKGAALLGAKLKAVTGPEQEDAIDIRLLSSKLALERRAPQADYPQVVEELLERTTETPDENRAHFRLLALLYKRRLIARGDLRQSLELLGEVEELAARFPDIRYTNAYVGHLRDSARIANRLDDRMLSQNVEKWTEELLQSEQITDEWKQVIWLRLIPHFLCEFSTPEQLAKRIVQLRELESTTQGSASEVVIWKVNLLYTIGYLDETVRTAEQGIQLYRELGLMPEVSSCIMLSIFARVLLGGDLAVLTGELAALLESRAQPLQRQLQWMMGVHGSIVGLMIDQPEWRSNLLEMTAPGSPNLPVVDDLMAALYAGDLAQADTLLGRSSETWGPMLRPFMAAALGAGPPADLREALDSLRPILGAPILEMKDILVKRIIMEILMAAQKVNLPAEAAEAIRTELHSPLCSIMTWFADRSLATGMTVTMERYGAFFPKGELKSWRARVAASIAQRESTAEQAGRRTKVSLLGSIVIHPPGEEPVRVRGAQLCTLLGLMTADRMLARPLTQNEFVAIVMGSERDPESARKSMNFAVFRLRELLGSDAISTTGETPALNLDLIEVDLLDAHRHLRDALEALRDGALLRAYPKVIAALDITAGQVPFPTLYDELFESAREDFETELRTAVLRIARALRREGDDAAAEQVLLRAFQAMQDDEEVAELLQEVLRALGKRTEATRIGMRGD